MNKKGYSDGFTTEISSKVNNEKLHFIGSSAGYFESANNTRHGLCIPNINDSVLAVNDISSGLITGITNVDFLGRYQNIVQTQGKVFDDCLIFGEDYKLKTSEINNFIGSSIAPISSVIAGVGLATVNADRMYQMGSINKELFINTQKISDLCLDTVQGQQGFFVSALDDIQSTGTFQSITDSMAAAQVISSGINTVLHSLPTYPTDIRLLNLEAIYEKGKVTEEEYSEHQEKLDKLLVKISPELVEYRKACWKTFKNKGGDYIGQSTSSMRRLVDTLIRILAPTEKVVETEFFKKSDEAKDEKGRPNRKARVYHIMKYDQKKTEHFERLTKGFLEAYGNLSAWDHQPLKHDCFVYGVFVTIEGFLISLLSETE